MVDAAGALTTGAFVKIGSSANALVGAATPQRKTAAVSEANKLSFLKNAIMLLPLQ